MAEIDIADSNLTKLKRIQEVIHIEEGIETNIDETLGRVLDFYRVFVPYSPGASKNQRVMTII
jgi:hypothetical protein